MWNHMESTIIKNNFNGLCQTGPPQNALKCSGLRFCKRPVNRPGSQIAVPTRAAWTRRRWHIRDRVRLVNSICAEATHANTMRTINSWCMHWRVCYRDFEKLGGHAPEIHKYIHKCIKNAAKTRLFKDRPIYNILVLPSHTSQYEFLSISGAGPK